MTTRYDVIDAVYAMRVDWTWNWLQIAFSVVGHSSLTSGRLSKKQMMSSILVSQFSKDYDTFGNEPGLNFGIYINCFSIHAIYVLIHIYQRVLNCHVTGIMHDLSQSTYCFEKFDYILFNGLSQWSCPY